MPNEEIERREVKCDKCGRIYSTLFPDCPFCDTHYKVVKGQ